MATIKEVAKVAQVSVGTVSNVMSGRVPVSKKLRERVLSVVQQLDYQPNHVARSLKIRQTKMIGVIIDDITSASAPQVLRGAEDAAWRANYMLVMFNSGDQPDRERQSLSLLRGRRVDGILISITEGSDQNYIAALKDSGIPVVAMNRDLAGHNIDYVVADYSTGIRECARHLAELGHRRVGFINGELNHHVCRQRYSEFRAALKDFDIPCHDDLFLNHGSRHEDGSVGARRLLAMSPGVTAIVAATPMLAAGVLAGLKEAKLACPEDLTVISLEDPDFISALFPPLTAVTQPWFQIGNQAMDLLFKRIEEPARAPAKVLLETNLVVRASSAPARR